MFSGIVNNKDQIRNTGEHDDQDDEFWFQEKRQCRAGKQSGTKACHSLDNTGEQNHQKNENPAVTPKR